MKLADFLVLFCFVFVSEVWGKLYHGTKFRFGIFSLIRVTSPKTGRLYFYLLLFFSFILCFFIFIFILLLFLNSALILFVNFFSLSRSARWELKALHVVKKVVASEFLHIKMGSGESHLSGTIRI